jgi:hypothetical protein
MRKRVCGRGKALPAIALCFGLVLATVTAVQAQSGTDGITSATTEIKKYFGVGTNLMYAIDGIVGLVGAIKVYNKWSAGICISALTFSSTTLA